MLSTVVSRRDFCIFMGNKQSHKFNIELLFYVLSVLTICRMDGNFPDNLLTKLKLWEHNIIIWCTTCSLSLFSIQVLIKMKNCQNMSKKCLKNVNCDEILGWTSCMMRKNFNILSKGPSSEGYVVCTVVSIVTVTWRNSLHMMYGQCGIPQLI